MGRGRTSEYPKAPVVVVFKTSNRSNAKVKMKVFKNRNVDQVLEPDKKLPGIPDNAIWLHVGVGESFIKTWQSKYKL
tara:strand:- start:126 stop:356 length:231 start_codon:yes stop_codon:yes gene_type:complete